MERVKKLSIGCCKKVLESGGKKYSDEETEQIRELLYRLGELDYLIPEVDLLRRSLQDNKATNLSGLSALLVAPAGIEPASSESESEILSIEIRSHLYNEFQLNSVPGTGEKGRKTTIRPQK